MALNNQLKKGAVVKLHGYVPKLSVRAQIEKIEVLGNGELRYHTTVHEGPKYKQGPYSFVTSEVNISRRIITFKGKEKDVWPASPPKTKSLEDISAREIELIPGSPVYLEDKGNTFYVGLEDGGHKFVRDYDPKKGTVEEIVVPQKHLKPLEEGDGFMIDGKSWIKRKGINQERYREEVSRYFLSEGGNA